MSDVKIFRVSGRFRMGERYVPFRKEIRAMKPEDALEIVYSELGSKHKIKRTMIKIEKIEEITPEQAEDHLVLELSKKTPGV